MQIQRKEDMVLGFILGGFALLVLHLIVSGSIVLYISSKLIWLSKLADVLLIGMAIAKLVPIRHNHNHSHGCCDHGHTCSSGHHHTHSINYLRITLFLLPIVIGFAMQPRVLGATALANSINTAGPVPFYAISSSKNVYGMLETSSKTTANSSKATNSVESVPIDSSITSNNQSATNKPSSTNKSSATNKVNSQNFSGSQSAKNAENKLVQTVNSVAKNTDLVDLALKIYDHPDQAYEQHWRLTCFVYKDPKLTKNYFVMARVVVACCVADATPIGIIAETPDATTFKADTWLEVEGVLQKRIVKDADKIQPVSNLQATEDGTPYFVVKSWKIVSAPKEPYLVPPM